MTDIRKAARSGDRVKALEALRDELHDDVHAKRTEDSPSIAQTARQYRVTLVALEAPDRRERLEALRDRLAEDIYRGWWSAAPLALQFREVVTELAELADPRESPVDELEERRRRRLARRAKVSNRTG